jgi:DNA-binding HxlR family transcriptional regulator
MDVLGKRWTGLIVRVLLGGPRRFAQIAAAIDGLSDKMLSDRLKELEAEGILERLVYPDTPVRVEYALTAKGRDLEGVVAAIQAWAHAWQPAPGRAAEMSQQRDPALSAVRAIVQDARPQPDGDLQPVGTL